MATLVQNTLVRKQYEKSAIAGVLEGLTIGFAAVVVVLLVIVGFVLPPPQLICIAAC